MRSGSAARPSGKLRTRKGSSDYCGLGFDIVRKTSGRARARTSARDGQAMGTIMASWRMLGCRTYIARVQVPLTTIGERAGSCTGQVSSESTPRRLRRRCSYGRAPSANRDDAARAKKCVSFELSAQEGMLLRFREHRLEFRVQGSRVQSASVGASAWLDSVVVEAAVTHDRTCWLGLS